MGGPERCLKLRLVAALSARARWVVPPGAAPFSQCGAAGGAGCQRRRPAKNAILVPIRCAWLFRCRAFGGSFRAPAAGALRGPAASILGPALLVCHGHSRRQGSRSSWSMPHPACAKRNLSCCAAGGDSSSGLVPPGGTTTAAALLQQLLAGSKGDTTAGPALVALLAWWGASLSGVNRASLRQAVMLESPSALSIAAHELPRPPSRPPWNTAACRPARFRFRAQTGWCCRWRWTATTGIHPPPRASLAVPCFDDGGW